MYKVNVGKKILVANEEYAAKNSRYLGEHGKLCLNMISSPGSGKTTILTRTINQLRAEINRLYPEQLAAGHQAYRIAFQLLPPDQQKKC